MEPIYYILIFVVIALALGLGLGLGLEKKKDKRGDGGGTSETVRWVAAGNESGGINSLMYSTDGISWQVSSSTGASFSVRSNGVAYGTTNGTSPLWVAAGNDANSSNNLMYSTDGISWQVSTGASFSQQGFGVAYGTTNGTTPLWVAAGDDLPGGTGVGNIMYSTDGKIWEVSSSTGASFSSSGNDVAYGTSSDGTTPLWVAAGNGGGGNASLMYSKDGISWQISTGESFVAQCLGVAYGTCSDGTTPLWVAAGSNTGSDNKNMLYSTDGISWQVSTGASFSSSGNGVAYGTSSDGTTPLWVATGNDTNSSNNLMYSTDGKNWQVSTGASFSSSGNGVAYGTSSDGTTPLWVAAGNDTNSSNNLMYSTDGKNWQISTGESFSQQGIDVASITPNPALP